MATTPKDIEEFIKLRRELTRKYGNALLNGPITKEMYDEINPLAKYARTTPERIITSMLRDHLEGGE